MCPIRRPLTGRWRCGSTAMRLNSMDFFIFLVLAMGLLL
jgi:hypothetical protein